MDIGYALLAVTIFLVAVVLPTMFLRSRVALATPVGESESERLRLVNSVDRWRGASSKNHGTILPNVEGTMDKATQQRVDPSNLRSIAGARARARARVAERNARIGSWGMGLGVVVLLTLVAWILALTTAVATWTAVVFTLATVGFGAFFGMLFASARQATAKDLAAIEKLTNRLDALAARARVQDRPASAQAEKKMPRRVAQARAVSARSAQSAPSARSAPEIAPAVAPVREKPAPVVARVETPSYTPKPVYQRRGIKPFVPEAAPTASVPYRPRALGEQFTGGLSAASADAAPTIDTISFDDVLEARKHA